MIGVVLGATTLTIALFLLGIPSIAANGFLLLLLGAAAVFSVARSFGGTKSLAERLAAWVGAGVMVCLGVAIVSDGVGIHPLAEFAGLVYLPLLAIFVVAGVMATSERKRRSTSLKNRTS
jgi:hypothetical protein